MKRSQIWGTTLLAVLTTSIATARIATAESTAKSTWIFNPTTGHYYRFSALETWHQAREEALADGGYLVTINDAAENAWLVTNFQGTPADSLFWIGYNDELSEGNFVWDNGESPGYTNWDVGEPNNAPANGGEDFAHMFGAFNTWGATPGTWNDVNETINSFYGIIERDALPLPASSDRSLALLAFILVAVGVSLCKQLWGQQRSATAR